MLRILLIAYSFPPIQEPQSLRWYFISQELCNLGCQVDVITSDFYTEDNFQYSPNLKIYRIFPGYIEYLARKKKKKLGLESAFDKKIRNKFYFKMLKKVYGTLKNLLSILLPGDYRTEWLPFVIDYIKKKRFNLNNYDCIITSHEPHVDSLIGYYLKKKYGIKWVADFGDPYVAIYTPKIKIPFEKIVERKIYSLADGLILTNRMILSKILNDFPFLNPKKAMILYQGFSKNYLSKCIKEENLTQKNKLIFDNQYLNMIYAGSFYKKFREPNALIDAVKSLIIKGYKIRLYIAGRNDFYFKLGQGFEKNIIFLGFVHHCEVIKFLSLADLLVGITNKTDLQIPGKFFEYFGFRKPILCITYDNKNEIIELMNKYKRGFVSLNEKNSIESSLKHTYELWKSGELYNSFNLEPIEEFSFEYQAKLLLDFIKNFTNSNFSLKS